MKQKERIKLPIMKIPDIRLLSLIFQKYSQIQAVYLFGSRASGKTHKESDFDLAIVPQGSGIRSHRLDILHDLAKVGFCDVDLIFLDTTDIVLKYEAVRMNKVIYQTKDFDKGAMYSKVVRQYLDFLPYLKVQREAYKRRILSGQT